MEIDRFKVVVFDLKFTVWDVGGVWCDSRLGWLPLERFRRRYGSSGYRAALGDQSVYI